MRDDRLWRVLLLLSALMLVVHLGYAPFFNPDEGRYASASLEMARGFEGRAPDWVVPHLNGVPRLNKPPLVYWTAGLSMKLLGDSEVAGRMPSALAALGVMALLLWLGQKLFSPRAGILGALIWATAAFPFICARVLNTDMLLCFAITLATAGVWRVLESVRENTRQNFGAVLAAGLGMGLALLAKGPVGVAFPILIGFATLVAGYWQPGAASGHRFSSAAWNALKSTVQDLRHSKVLWSGLFVALIIALAMATPWVLAISSRVPDFLHRFLLEENVARFAGGREFHKQTPIWYYLPFLLVGLLPWTGLLMLTASASNSAHLPDEDLPRQTRARRFLWLWALVIVGVFSLSSTKLVTYVLPAFPALCLLLGEGFARLETAEENGSSRPRFWSISVWATVILNMILALALYAYLSDDKTLPRSEGLPISLALRAILIGGSVVMLMAQKRSVRAVFVTLWATATLLYIGLLPTVSRISLYEDAGAMFRALRPHLRPDDAIVLYREFQPTAIFYRGDPVYIVAFLNNSGLDEAALKTSKYFVSDPTHRPRQFLTRPQRTFLLYRYNDAAAQRDLSDFPIIARNNDYSIVSNRPAPSDFKFDYIAPGKLERWKPR